MTEGGNPDLSGKLLIGQVTALAAQLGRVSMASDSIPRSLLEPPARQLVRHLAQQRLVCGIAPSQGIEADLVGIEVHLGADQAVRPRRIDLEVATQQLNAAGRPGPP